MDLEVLLAPRESNPPSGDNLEYEDVYLAMEIAARPVEERQAGEEILESEDPDFGDVAQKALAVLERSHDLRAGVILAGAQLFTRGFHGFTEGVGYIRGCLEQHWESCHPQLDAEDDDDPTMRINALQGLAEPDTILRGLRATPLTDSRTFGRATLRDIQIASGHVTLRDAESPQFDSAALAAAFRDTAQETLTDTLGAAQSALEHFRAIERIFADRTPGQGPQLAEPIRLLQQIIREMAAVADVAVDTGEDDAEAEGSVDASAKPARGAPGQILSPADVRTALDAIVAYYQKNEPSSPVPILILRAKRLVGADFMSIVNELAPQSIDNVRLIGGLSDEEY